MKPAGELYCSDVEPGSVFVYTAIPNAMLVAFHLRLWCGEACREIADHESGRQQEHNEQGARDGQNPGRQLDIDHLGILHCESYREQKDRNRDYWLNFRNLPEASSSMHAFDADVQRFWRARARPARPGYLSLVATPVSSIGKLAGQIWMTARSPLKYRSDPEVREVP